MNRSVIAFTLLALAAGAFAETTTQPAAESATAPAATQPAADGNTTLQDASYGIGFNMGQQLTQAPFKLDIDRLVEGLRDASGGKKPAVSEAAIRAALEQLQKDAMAGAGKAAEVNAKAGDDFRSENAKKTGVTTTASGLQIETIQEGTGETPKATDTVKVHYTGTLIDGTKFDSSVDRGEPVTFPLNKVIPGWTEGLQLMKVGGKSRLVIPPTIGYGPSGSGPIPPNSTLVFDIELISIEK